MMKRRSALLVVLALAVGVSDVFSASGFLLCEGSAALWPGGEYLLVADDAIADVA